jgi:hypothetical protein
MGNKTAIDQSRLITFVEETLKMYKDINPVGGWQWIEDEAKSILKEANSDTSTKINKLDLIIFADDLIKELLWSHNKEEFEKYYSQNVDHEELLDWNYYKDFITMKARASIEGILIQYSIAPESAKDRYLELTYLEILGFINKKINGKT